MPSIIDIRKLLCQKCLIYDPDLCPSSLESNSSLNIDGAKGVTYRGSTIEVCCVRCVL